MSEFNKKRDIWIHGETAKVAAKNKIYWTYHYPIDQFYGVIYVPVSDMQGQPFENELNSRLLTRWLDYAPPKKENILLTLSR